MVSTWRKTDKVLFESWKAKRYTNKSKALATKDITYHKEINACICKFYKNLFKKNVTKSDLEKKSFLDSIALPNLTSKSFDICESEITEKDLITALKSMPNRKSPGNDGLTKEFYEHFWDDLKFYFINSLKQSKSNGRLSISQRQAIIKLIAKKDRDKRFNKNGYVIYLIFLVILLQWILKKRLIH